VRKRERETREGEKREREGERESVQRFLRKRIVVKSGFWFSARQFFSLSRSIQRSRLRNTKTESKTNFSVEKEAVRKRRVSKASLQQSEE
jgi:hypothetical protein